MTNNKTLKIRYKNSTSGTGGYIYYMTDDDTGFTGSKIKAFSPTANSDYTEYTLTMPANFTGTLTKLRIDLPGSTGSFSIDYIRIGSDAATPTPTLTSTPVTFTPTPGPSNTMTGTATPTSTRTPTRTITRTSTASLTVTPFPGGFTAVKSWNFDSSVEGWTATDVSNFAWQPGGTIGGTISSSAARIFSATNLNINVTGKNIVKMRYKNTTSDTTAYLFYMTGDDTGFSGDKVKSFIVAANSDYTEYTLTMPASFTGTLTRLRFDPAGASGSFGVDYLRIGSQPATSTSTITPTPTTTLTPTITPTGPTPTATTIAPFPAFTTNVSATFVYDGDGKMVKSVIDGVTTIFVSSSYQVKDPAGQAVVTKYYEGGAFRVGGVLYYSLTDHIGSTSITIDPDGNKTEMRYTAWGEVRYQGGSLPTDRTYTGQRSYTSDFGLMYYNARWYDSSIGHFTQADTVVPGGVQGYDRYAYVSNNPIRNTDPTGHKQVCDTHDYNGHIVKDNCHDDGTGDQYMILACGRGTSDGGGDVGFCNGGTSLSLYQQWAQAHGYTVLTIDTDSCTKEDCAGGMLAVMQTVLASASGAQFTMVGHSAGADATLLAASKAIVAGIEKSIKGIGLLDPTLTASSVSNMPDVANTVAGKIHTFVGDTTDDKIITDIKGATYGGSQPFLYPFHPMYNMTHMELATSPLVFADFMTAMQLP